MTHPTLRTVRDDISTFTWITNDGRELSPCDMETSHLFNCVRMIWNHTAPIQYRLEPYRRWSLSHWSPEYRKQALKALCQELSTRTVTQDQAEQLAQMIRYVGEAFSSKLT